MVFGLPWYHAGTAVVEMTHRTHRGGKGMVYHGSWYRYRYSCRVEKRVVGWSAGVCHASVSVTEVILCVSVCLQLRSPCAA